MHNQSRLNGEIALDPSESLRFWQWHPSAATPPRHASERRAKPNDRASLRNEIDAYALHAMAANGFGDAIIGGTGRQLHPFAVRREQDAQAQVWRQFRQRIEATLLIVSSAARRMHARWKRRRQASATYFALQELDTRTLRDLGFERCEISSIAAEISGDAYSSRTRVVLAERGLPR